MKAFVEYCYIQISMIYEIKLKIYYFLLNFLNT